MTTVAAAAATTPTTADRTSKQVLNLKEKTVNVLISQIQILRSELNK
jgi:hypothetical protein